MRPTAANSNDPSRPYRFHSNRQLILAVMAKHPKLKGEIAGWLVVKGVVAKDEAQDLIFEAFMNELGIPVRGAP